jgi:hypothetical protein
VRPTKLRRQFLLLLCAALLSESASTQHAYRWEKVDTLTGGPFDDRNPSVFHGTFPGWYGQMQWMVFDRCSSSEAMIAAKMMLLK